MLKELLEECWYFTFGMGQTHQGKFVKIFGTYEQARECMMELYGTEWAFVYSQDDWFDKERGQTLNEIWNWVCLDVHFCIGE